jgi:hypothetical protein
MFAGMEESMASKYILPESVAQQDGAGAVIALEADCGMPLQLTLGITRIVEQESLEVSIWGSSDRQQWRQLTAFSRKFYCGNYSVLLDLTRHQDVRYLRAHWKMSRWANAQSQPLFGFYLLAQEPRLQAVGAA